MEIFFLVFFKIISVLLSVLVGFIAGKTGKVTRESIASLLFYFIAPIVFFAIPANSSLTLEKLSISLVTFTLSSMLCAFSYYFYGLFWQDERRNILAMSSGTGNAVYFSLPIAASLFDIETLSIYMLAAVGVSIYEASVGFYVSARSISSTADSLMRVLKLPILNAFILGCIMSAMGFNLPDFLDDFIANMRSSMSILGMMIIGLGVSTLQNFDIDYKFTSGALLGKFLFAPLTTASFIFLDKHLFHWYDDNYYDALLLLSSAPMAANTIVIASVLRFYPERVAAAVLISCIFVLVYMPAVVTLFIQ